MSGVRGHEQAEVAESDGWTTLYDGKVCYDVQAGMLVFMSLHQALGLYRHI